MGHRVDFYHGLFHKRVTLHVTDSVTTTFSKTSAKVVTPKQPQYTPIFNHKTICAPIVEHNSTTIIAVYLMAILCP